MSSAPAASAPAPPVPLDVLKLGDGRVFTAAPLVDVTLLNPFGGYRGRGYAEGVTATRQRAIGQFESGPDASIELFQAITSDDLIVLAGC